MGLSCFSVPPRRANVRELSRAISASRPRRTSVVFSRMPVSFSACRMSVSSMLSVVFTVVSLLMMGADVKSFCRHEDHDTSPPPSARPSPGGRGALRERIFDEEPLCACREGRAVRGWVGESQFTKGLIPDRHSRNATCTRLSLLHSAIRKSGMLSAVKLAPMIKDIGIPTDPLLRTANSGLSGL